MHTSRPRRRLLPLLAGALLAGVVAAAAPADAATTTVSYTGPAVPIPDVSSASATLAVNGLGGSISHLGLRFDGTDCSDPAKTGIEHTYDHDIRISLKSPAGTTVVVADQVGSFGDNFCKTLLDDAASTPLVNGSAPFTGTFRPSNPLSAFNGQNPNGTWTLKVEDLVSGDSGNIRAFSLLIDGTSVVTGLAPSITGLAKVGQTLTAQAGAVSPADSTLSYVWKADGVAIPN
jgi:subtilisin-like proprotein convertase family protein